MFIDKIKFFISIALIVVNVAIASKPTEEGLLKNVHNEMPSGNNFTYRAQITNDKKDPAQYLKIQFMIGDRGNISLLQTLYSDAQMHPGQVLDVKMIPDLITAIRKEVVPEKALFYSTLIMLLSNQSIAMEVFLEKSSVKIIKTKTLVNEEKLKLLKNYKNYLQKNTGRGETGSPLNPSDSQEKNKAIALFKSNSLEESKNIQLTKVEKDFLWKVDWRKIQGYFTNEERQFKKWEFSLVGAPDFLSLEASDYLRYNSVNELPKLMKIQIQNTNTWQIELLSADNRSTVDKTLNEKWEEARKQFVNKQIISIPSFLF